jgi:hypothetical protein
MSADGGTNVEGSQGVDPATSVPVAILAEVERDRARRVDVRPQRREKESEVIGVPHVVVPEVRDDRRTGLADPERVGARLAARADAKAHPPSPPVTRLADNAARGVVGAILDDEHLDVIDTLREGGGAADPERLWPPAGGDDDRYTRTVA